MYSEAVKSLTRRARVAAIGLSTLTAGACSPYAVIQRRAAPPLEARIISADAESLTVESTEGESVRVLRADIDSIDHPGNVAMALGLPNTVVGSLFAVITIFMLPAAIEQGWPEGDSERVRAAPLALGFGVFAGLNLAVGLPPFLWGSRMWFTSTGNAQPSEQSSVTIGLSPGGLQVRF